jgi:hypothetical protein
MNPLRENLCHAILSFALLATIALGTDRGTVGPTQIQQATQRASAAMRNFLGIDSLRARCDRATLGDALKQSVRRMLDEMLDEETADHSSDRTHD